MNLSQLVFQYLPNVRDLPLILAGPILRRTDSDSVTVWLAIKEARSLILEIYETEQGATLSKLLFKTQSDTIPLGKHLHIVAITAKAPQDKQLQPGKIYAYNIICEKDNYDLIEETKISRCSFSYFDHQLPTFSLPPEDLNQLKIIHGSCRKPHGGGKDTLFYVDNLIHESANSAYSRPHQLFLTGDQIYGDDVADPFLWLTQGVSQLLFDWSEELPLISGKIAANELIPGKRTEIARIEGGLTSMLRGKPEKAKSHLFSFGEYAIAYLLSWSSVFIPKEFPTGKSLFQDSKQARSWDKETKAIDSFLLNLHFVRRGLANIPVYTICDDHDVSDDWYLNREWCDRVLGKPLGKRVVQNGLLAYGLFQAWGNTPEHFALGTGGARLIELAVKWLASEGEDQAAKAECDRYLGIPVNDRLTHLPKLEKDEDVLILSRDSQAIPWHYTVRGSKHEVIVLDTRAWRGYPEGKDRGLEPPMLLCPKAFKQQLHAPLSQSNPEIEATMLVLPTNLVALEIIDKVQQFELNRDRAAPDNEGDRVFSSDVGDSWNFRADAFAQLLITLTQQRQRVIILSGDIHYSCAVRLSHWFHDSGEGSVLAQLTSSAIKNSEVTTRLVHTKLKSLFPEKTQRWLGWNDPFTIAPITKSNLKQHKYSDTLDFLPDWQYRIEWCERQPAQSLSWQKFAQQSVSKNNHSSSNPIINIWRKLIQGSIDLLWRNPWLQDGSEVVGRNNISLVKFQWSTNKAVIQETYWHSPWSKNDTVKSCYEVSLDIKPLPPIQKINHH